VLDEVGWVQDVVVNRRSGYVVDGHLRVALAVSRGEPSIPVVYVDLDPKEELLVLAALDPLAAMAGTDPDALASLVGEITVPAGALKDMLAQLAGAAGPKVGETGPDDVPEVPEEPYVQRGELYALGDHRLLCGDATNAEDVARLLAGDKPRLMITDPPYGVDFDPGNNPSAVNDRRDSRRRRGTFDDGRADWREAYALAPAEVAYVWHASTHVVDVAASIDACGYERRAYLIWAKQAHTFGRGHYHWQHEPCWYAVRKGAKAHWIGDRSQSTLWRIDNVHPTHGTTDDGETDHGTQKPVECMERPLRNHEGDVYDPFLGSGTTMIAAQRLGRRCYGVEIEPRYVQVAIERWEAFTGGKAERVDG
jgi:DNA modification methylase